MLSGKSILVTGAAGFVGQHLVRELANLGNKVIALDKDSVVHDVFQSENIETICADLTSDEIDSIYKRILPETELCFHLAAVASVQQSQENWLKTHEINSVAFVKILDAVSKINSDIKVVYASSAAVYGDKSGQVVENDLVNPISVYGYDKIACENHAKIAYDFFDISSVGLRFFNIYGRGQDPHSDYSGVVSKFLQNIQNDQPIKIYGDGEQVRDFIYIKDVVRALILSMNYLTSREKTHEIINICTGEETSIVRLVDILYALANKEKEIVFEAKKEGDIYYSLGNPSKAKDIISFTPKVSLEEGLKDYLSAVS